MNLWVCFVNIGFTNFRRKIIRGEIDFTTNEKKNIEITEHDASFLFNKKKMFLVT